MNDLATANPSSRSSSARRRNPNPDDLDRLAASLHHLTLWCCEPDVDETDDRRPPEAVAMHKQFLVDAMSAAGEQF